MLMNLKILNKLTERKNTELPNGCPIEYIKKRECHRVPRKLYMTRIIP